jgi:GT2 family glycosyltransferase
MLSAIVLTWNGRAHIARCLASIAAQTEPPDETLVVDNGSLDETVAIARKHAPWARVVALDRNIGFAPGMNHGARLAQGDVLLFLNQDIELRPDACAQLRQVLAARPEVGIVGAKLLEADGVTIQHAGGWLRRPLFLADHYGHGEPDRGQYACGRAVEFVNGAVLAIRRCLFERLGGFDEGFAPAYFEETDLCARARARGAVVWYAPEVCAVHYSAATLGQATRAYYACYHRGRVRFALKHAGPDLAAFFAAERVRLREPLSTAERAGLAEAYVVSVLRDCAEAAVNDSSIDVAAELAALRAQVYAAHGQAPPAGAPPAAAPTGAAVDPLAAQAALREHVFRSRLPLVGSLVAGFRRLWNDVSTRWYVRPLIEQQSAFNAALVERLAEIEARLGETDRELALVLREVASLREAVARHGRERGALS